MIAIIDYGMGNLHSVHQAIERLGFQGVITNKKEVLEEASGVILPGVGAFGDAMRNLNDSDLTSFIQKIIHDGKPFLGICLGMQLLFTSSEEHGFHNGLDILKGTVKRFQGSFKIPHMGWNELMIQQPNHPLLKGIKPGHVYFVHSYYVEVENKEVLLATTEYYQEVPAIVGFENVIGMQFHPEKSGKVGMELLKRFVKWSEELK